MPKIVIERAHPHVDENLKRILRENTPEGSIRIRYEREPSFRGGCQVEGTDLELAYAKDVDAEKLIGICVRATKACYINQEKAEMGYLSSLRIDKSYRNTFALIKFYRYLKTVHQASSCKWDIMMITAGNHQAEQLFLSRRAGLPGAYSLGRFFTFSLGLKQAKNKVHSDPSIRTLREDELDKWFDFLNRVGPRQRELFPEYQKSHLNTENGLLKGIKPENIYVAIENDRIIGTVSVWDQNPFKQYYIDGYSRGIGLFRGVYNAYARLTGRPVLPRVGQPLKSVFLSTICIEEDREDVFEKLLKRARSDLAFENRFHSLMTGFHERDPLVSVVKKLPHVRYESEAWLVSWEDVESLTRHLSQSKIYLELGAL